MFLTKYFKICAAICAFIFFIPVTAAFSEDPNMPEDESAQVELTMTVVKELPLPKGYHEGLFLEDGRIWVNNGENKNIWVVDLATGEVLSEIIPPGHFTEGVTRSSDGAYWVSDWEDFRLYRAELSDGKLIANKNIPFTFARPAGVVWTGNNFYILTWTRTLLGTKYHLLLLDKEGQLLLKIKMRGISGPSQLAWDGKSLWVTSWYGGRVFRIDPVAFKVTGYFNSPASDATGIAWDGTNFWITGTDSNLFCIKVSELSK